MYIIWLFYCGLLFWTCIASTHDCMKLLQGWGEVNHTKSFISAPHNVLYGNGYLHDNAKLKIVFGDIVFSVIMMLLMNKFINMVTND